jgi:lactate dehydrogenase-like 2-hydroxyacid dehydrogenase
MTRVVKIDLPNRTGCDLDVEQSILGSDIELVHYFSDGDESDLISVCQDADIVLTDLVPYTRKVIEKMPRCQLISIAGTGYNNVDLVAAQDAHISVCAIEEYCTDEVADHVMLLALALSRRLIEYHDQVQTDKLWQFDSFTGLSRLRDKTLGIIGFGRIGQAVARRAQGFGLTILVTDRHLAEHAELDVQYCDLPTLLDRSDIISLNCNLSDDGKTLIDADAFTRMSRNPVLINCARGGLIDEAALAEALDSGQISGAGLDVFCDEPPDLAASKFTGRDNVIMTPHIAFYSDESILESREISANNVRNFLNGAHENVNKYIYRAASQASAI